MTCQLANGLANVQSPRFLFLSLWMHDPEQHKEYRKLGFRLSEKPLLIAPEVPPIPVMVDPCTDTYLQDKHVEYVWESFVDETSKERRARITKVRISPVAGKVGGIIDAWPSFMHKFLEFHRKPPGYVDSDDEASDDIDAGMDDADDDDDEEEEDRPARRRR